MCPEKGRERDLGLRCYPSDSLTSLGLEQEGMESLRYDVICPRNAVGKASNNLSTSKTQ